MAHAICSNSGCSTLGGYFPLATTSSAQPETSPSATPAAPFAIPSSSPRGTYALYSLPSTPSAWNPPPAPAYRAYPPRLENVFYLLGTDVQNTLQTTNNYMDENPASALKMDSELLNLYQLIEGYAENAF